jgi:hypothetical protein
MCEGTLDWSIYIGRLVAQNHVLVCLVFQSVDQFFHHVTEEAELRFSLSILDVEIARDLE